MSQLIYSPFGAFTQLHRELGRVFDDKRRDEPATSAFNNWVPQVDIAEHEEGFRVVIDVPGVAPNDIEVTHERNLLTIKGSRSTCTESEEKGLKRRERFDGNFMRQFTLPDNADEQGISAKVVNGVLEILIPRGNKTLSRKITVEG